MFRARAMLQRSVARLAIAVVGVVGQAACGAASNLAGPSAAPAMSYLLVAPLKSNNTYLMDLNGQLVHEWQGSHLPGLSVYLLPNGNLLRASSLGPDAFPAAGGN